MRHVLSNFFVIFIINLYTASEQKKKLTIPMKNRKIFVIEDNRTEGLLLKLSLNSFENITIHSFSKGNDLIENLTMDPDIVLVDLMLPDISGFELIRIIKEYNPDIRIIVVSAQKDIEMIAKVQAEGIYNYLVKSEGAIKYLKNVIEDLLIIMDYKEEQKEKPQ